MIGMNRCTGVIGAFGSIRPVVADAVPCTAPPVGELAQRTPPAERAALRRELLLQPPAQRGAWLSERARR